jgi:hypothetical protein
MKLILDFSKVKVGPELAAIPESSRKLPLKPGEIQKDFDLIECDVPKDVYAVLVKLNGGETGDYPFGMDITSIPVGAVITRVE